MLKEWLPMISRHTSRISMALRYQTVLCTFKYALSCSSRYHEKWTVKRRDWGKVSLSAWSFLCRQSPQIAEIRMCKPQYSSHIPLLSDFYTVMWWYIQNLKTSRFQRGEPTSFIFYICHMNSYSFCNSRSNCFFFFSCLWLQRWVRQL